MEPEQVCHFPLALEPDSIENHFLSALKNASLIPVGQVCDDGCQAICNKKPLQVLDSNKNLILTVKCNKSDGLWDIPPTPPSQPSQAANSIVHMNKTEKELYQLLHSACFSPAPSAFIQAIKVSTLPPEQG